jgi:hypothetical protein
VVNHGNLISDIADQGSRVFRRIEDLKLFLAFVQSPSEDSRAWRSAQRDARALAIVCTIAELEALTRFIIQRVHEELNSLALSIDCLKPSIRQLAVHSTFESLRSLQDSTKVWERRSYTTTLEMCSEIAVFPIEHRSPQPPLDGKTLKPEHFQRLWAIYSLPGYAFPQSAWYASLTKLSFARNDLAHGNLPFHEIFQQAGRSVDDVEQYVGDMELFARHFIDSWYEYIRDEGYLASRSG